MGIGMGLSFVSMYRPNSFSLFTTSTLAWKRFIPCSAVDSGQGNSGYPRRGTHLEMRSSVCIEGAVVVQNVDEIKLVSYSNIIIIWIVGGGDLHSTRPEGHINDDVVRHYWNTAVYEGMDSKLAMKVL